jgi:hypothetical protein
MDPLIKTPGKGSPDTIIGANEMTKAMINFATMINNFIQMNAELSAQLAEYQNTVNQDIPGQLTAKQKLDNVYDLLNGQMPSTLNSTQIAQLQQYSADQNVIMSTAQSQTQGVQTALTGSTNAIQALQQSQNEFTSEAGSTVDTTLANDRIQ